MTIVWPARPLTIRNTVRSTILLIETPLASNILVLITFYPCIYRKSYEYKAHELLHPRAEVVVDHATHNPFGRRCREVGVIVEIVRPKLGGHRRKGRA